MPKRVPIWLGFHPSLGILIYDPLRQRNAVLTNQVRLFDVQHQENRLFDKAVVKQQLVPFTRYLTRAGLDHLQTTHKIVAHVAKRYLDSRIEIGAMLIAEHEYYDADVGPLTEDHVSLLQAVDADSEESLIRNEISEDQDAWAKSGEDGWYYDS